MDNKDKIEILIKALGTMIMEPQYETDPNNLRKKTYLGQVQKPILEDKRRELVLDKLEDLIKEL